jgi:GT2 family glycosyltransferase
MSVEEAREEGAVAGVSGGAVVGWAFALDGVSTLELVAEGEGVVAEAALTASGEGPNDFRIPLPETLRDGTVRLLSVRRKGAKAPLPGGPIVFDGGLFAEDSPGGPSAAAVTATVEGAVTAVEDGIVKGWAWRPEEPEARCAIQVWRGDDLLVETVADLFDAGLLERGLGDGRHAFEVDATRHLAAGAEVVEIFVEGEAVPLFGGVTRLEGRGRDGLVVQAGYLDTPASLAKIEGVPYEHYAYEAATLAAGRLAPRLINRLRRERGLYEAGPDFGSAVLLNLGEGEFDTGWEIQSYPHASQAAPKTVAQLREAARAATKVYFARPGEVLHPSTAGVTLRMNADVVTWHRFEPTEWRAGAPGRLHIHPSFDAITTMHGATSDNTLCVKGDLLAQAPEAVLTALIAGRMHPLHFWLADRQGTTWAQHPEGLTIGPPPARDRQTLAADFAFFEQVILDGGTYTLTHVDDEGDAPFALLPVRRAVKISVLICFKDHAEATLACLHSIYRQHTTGDIEVVLVDNQSTPSEARRVREGAVTLFGDERLVFVDYDRPFNHSAQNNLAARVATGEVLVICNNDILLTDPTALEQMAAWALVSGVGAVGCRLDDPRRGVSSHGHKIGAPTSNPYRVPISEDADPTYGGFVHAVPGATLALAAIARSRFLEAGGLDEVDFPIGYNDVEFMFRVSRQGLRHLYLGHVHAQHERGSSRTGDNEALQALRLNIEYAHELGQYRRFLAVEQISPAAPKATDKDKGKGLPAPAAAGAKPVSNLRGHETLRLAAIQELEETRKTVDAVQQALSRMQALILDRTANP